MSCIFSRRKLLDDNKPGDAHFALKLHCHRALHVDLSGRDSTLPFLRRVDEFVGHALNDSNFAEQSRMFHEFGFLESFRQLLKLFFQSQGLPTQLCDDARWHSFLTLYAGVIEDGSLSCNAQPGDLARISGITFTKGRPAPEIVLEGYYACRLAAALIDGPALARSCGFIAGRNEIFALNA